MRTLVVAAGGGGDAITAAALAASRRRNSGPPVVMTYSWDRLMIDPVPGPRTAADFTGLHEIAPGLHEVLPTTRPIPPAGSSLPRLAAELPARLLLLDPAGGAVGMAEQITAAARHFESERIDLVDVGGDALTDGTDPGLRSPLADQLALAACARTGLPARLLITGAGLDGEIPPATIARRLARLTVESLAPLDSAEIEAVSHVFNWHPSEASGLLAAVAQGVRGRVEVRDAGDLVELSEAVAAVFAVEARRTARTTPASQLVETVSLEEADAAIRAATKRSEIEYEACKATRNRDRAGHVPRHDDLSALDRLTVESCRRGADFVSTRRLAELLGVAAQANYEELCALLIAHRSSRHRVSLLAANSDSHCL